MNNLQALSDKAAISLSFLCTAHCLALPVMLALIPSIAALQLENESFHFWLIVAVLPTSIYALTMGCRKHKRYTLLALGLTGISFLVLAIILCETLLEGSAYGEAIEKIMTSVGAMIIAYAHFRNYRLCRSQPTCSCPDTQHSAT